MKDKSANIRMFATVAGLFVPCMSIKFEQTAYGIADALTITTPLSISPDYGAISQKYAGQQKPVPVSISVAYVLDTGKINYVILGQGLLDEIENDYDNDIITLHGRGILANLIDSRITLKPNMSSTITTVIKQLIQRYSGLTPIVSSSSLLAGAVLKTDYISMSRNLRALDLIHILARSQGWTVRVVNSNIVVGPPPDPSYTPVFLKHAESDFISLKVSHNALHNKNIKVKIVSYQRSTKTRTVSRSKPTPYLDLLGQPAPAAPSKGSVSPVPALDLLGVPAPPGVAKGAPKKAGGTSGGVVSGVTSVGERDNVEEYVIPIANLTPAQCQERAQSEADAINRHEFVATAVFIPTASDFYNIISNSPDFHIKLRGCSQPSNDGLYFMQHVDWDWDISSSSGLTIETEMMNHPLPIPSGNQANAELPLSGGLPVVDGSGDGTGSGG